MTHNIHYENNGNYQKTYISSEFEENKLNCHESEKCILTGSIKKWKINIRLNNIFYFLYA